MRCPNESYTPCLNATSKAPSDYALLVCGQGLYKGVNDVQICFGADPVLPTEINLSPQDETQVMNFIREQFIGILTNESFALIAPVENSTFSDCVLQASNQAYPGIVNYNNAATFLAVPASANQTQIAEEMFCGCVTPFTYFPNLAAGPETQRMMDQLNCKTGQNTNLTNILVPSLFCSSLFFLALGFVFGKYWGRRNNKPEEKESFFTLSDTNYGANCTL